MRIKVEATCKPEVLVENLRIDYEVVERNGPEIILEVDDPSSLEKTPGIGKIVTEDQKIDGLGGKPVDEEAYAKLETKEDAVKALLATIKGYDLRILNTDRNWDYRQLKKYNPGIKHLKFDEPKEMLKIDKTVFPSGMEEVEIEVEQDKIDEYYRKMLT